MKSPAKRLPAAPSRAVPPAVPVNKVRRRSSGLKFRGSHSPGGRVRAQSKDIEAVGAPRDNRRLRREHAAEGFPTAGDGGAGFEVGARIRGRRRGRGHQSEAVSQEAGESGEANHDCEARSVGCWCVSAEC